jgi:hypothetical protein
MNEELPAGTQAEIDRIAEEGNRLLEAGDPCGALAAFRRGLQRLPEPRERWSAAFWFLCSIGDAQWFMRDHREGLRTWRDALLQGGIGNAFVHLRRGQTLLELGERDEAGNELFRALLLGGERLFAGEDPRYLAFITSIARPPAGLESWRGWQGVEPTTPGFEWLADPNHYQLVPRGAGGAAASGRSPGGWLSGLVRRVFAKRW